MVLTVQSLPLLNLVFTLRVAGLVALLLKTMLMQVEMEVELVAEVIAKAALALVVTAEDLLLVNMEEVEVVALEVLVNLPQFYLTLLLLLPVSYTHLTLPTTPYV